MNLINRSILIIITSASIVGASINVKQSYNILMNSDVPIHATPHINNLVRNGAYGLNELERSRLNEIGLECKGNSISILDPILDQSYLVRENDKFEVSI